MPPREAVAVTGAAGFLGRPISRALADRKDLRLFGREARQTENGAVRALDDMSGLSGVSCVVHLAGIPTSQAPEADILRVNVDLACDVARAAGAAGVERFILFSSLHVHGKATGACIGPESPFAPHNAYGRSKVQAEEAVGNICRETGMRLVILRPPMIYGPGGRGSFFQLLKLVRLGLPLPFGAARAPRSFCAIANLVSGTIAAIDHAVPPRVLCPADPEDFTTRDLILAMKASCPSRSALVSVRPVLIKALLAVAGQEEMYRSLFEPLTIDRGHWATWNWLPVQSGFDGVRDAILGAEG